MIKILKFESDSCPQCKALSVTLERITKEYKTDMKSIDIEEDNNQDLIRKYNIRSIPTLIFLNEDKEYNRLVGNQPYATINKIINYDTI
jgi:thioredoxin-like negative regulator of GroEL|nr:MAG TPA: TRX family protein [Bacteriophage sp.]